MSVKFTTQMKEAVLRGDTSFLKYKPRKQRASMKFDKIVVRRGEASNTLVLELHHGAIPLAYFESQCNFNAGDVVVFAGIEGKTSVEVGV